jgi:hypothetical protein
MTKLLLNITIPVEETHDVNEVAETIYDGFQDYLVSDPGFGESMSVHTDCGHHKFPEDEMLNVVHINGHIEAYNGVDYVNDAGNRDGLTIDVKHAVQANMSFKLYDATGDIQVSITPEAAIPEVTDDDLPDGYGVQHI